MHAGIKLQFTVSNKEVSHFSRVWLF